MTRQTRERTRLPPIRPALRLNGVKRWITNAGVSKYYWNPVSAVTAAARHLWADPNPSATIRAWPMQHPVDAALLWSIALLAIFAPLAARLYRHRTTN